MTDTSNERAPNTRKTAPAATLVTAVTDRRAVLYINKVEVTGEAFAGHRRHTERQPTGGPA